jgi:hypothetical protein
MDLRLPCLFGAHRNNTGGSGVLGARFFGEGLGWNKSNHRVCSQVDNLRHVHVDADEMNATLAKLSSSENPIWGPGHDRSSPKNES